MKLLKKIKSLLKINPEYISWDKKHEFMLSEHFSSKEMRCRCTRVSCQEQVIAIELLNRLEKLRNLIGPIQVNSAFRCAAHQEKLRKQGIHTAKKLSQHELGKAVDIQSNAIGGAALYFKSIGLAKTWMHLDLRDDKIRRWTY